MQQKMFSRGTLVTLVKKYNNTFFKLTKQQQQSLHSYYIKEKCIPFFIPTNIKQYSCDRPLKCWNCNFIYKSELFCSKCKKLQEPPEDLTYFDIIGVPVRYDVTITEIQKKYKELQKLLHPDKFGNKSEKEKQLSENLSSLVNRAYSTLLNPLQRGLYMLELKNIKISEETDGTDPEFLMEIMEINEKIENALSNHAKIKELEKENNTMLNSLSVNIAEAFREEDIKKAKAYLIRMKYYNSINSRLKKLKHDLGIVA